MTKTEPIGIITSRQCPTCGHHEVGYTTSDGTFHPLKPGDMVQVIEQGLPATPPQILQNMGEKIPALKDDESIAYDIWVPDPVQCNQFLSMKYGVLIPSGLLKGEMTEAFYEMAYKQKLIMLLDKELFTPLPILLDRFFSAPNLVTGNPKQIAEAIFQELNAIKGPVIRVKEWLEKKDDASLEKLIHPKSIDSLNGQSMNDDQIKQALQDLSLEEFFELL
ncbi:hypothetical protein ACFL7M_05625 [Thermodesulfobacteriota bacterium]